VGDRRRPAAVAAAARGKRLGGRRLGQHVTSGGALGSCEASGVVGRWGERAVLQGPCGGGNGGVAARWRVEGEKGGA
jgi:hypothetical protein